jgi:hypothetical protein
MILKIGASFVLVMVFLVAHTYAQSNGNESDGSNIVISQSKTPGPGLVRDTIQPRIVSVSPADGTIRVPLLPTITATFSEPMQGSTISTSTFQIRDNEDKIVQGTITKEPRGLPQKVIMFKPLSLLAPAMQYSVTVTTDAKDLAGNPLANSTKWYFTTTQNQAFTGTFQPPKDNSGTIQPPIDTSEPSADIVSPRVVSVRPMTGATNIPVTSNVIVTFSEPVLHSTVSITTFKLTTMGTNYGQGPFGQIPVPTVVNVPGTVSLSNDGKTATFRPAQQLMTSRDYYYSLTGVIDLAGNPLAPVPNFKGSFTTSPP